MGVAFGQTCYVPEDRWVTLTETDVKALEYKTGYALTMDQLVALWCEEEELPQVPEEEQNRVNDIIYSYISNMIAAEGCFNTRFEDAGEGSEFWCD